MRIVIAILLSVNLLLAGDSFMENWSFFGVIAFFGIYGSIVWVPVLLVLGIIMCNYKMCKEFKYFTILIVGFIIFSFFAEMVYQYVKKERRKPSHFFVDVRNHSYYSNEKLEIDAGKEILSFDYPDSYYTKDGVLHCNGYTVEIKKSDIVGVWGRCWNFETLSTNNVATLYNVKRSAYNKRDRTLKDFNITNVSKKGLYGYKTKHKAKICKDNIKDNCYDPVRKVYYNKPYVINLNREPKLIDTSHMKIYIVFKDDLTKIYFIKEISEENLYFQTQNVAKNVINSAYIPWWSFYKSPYDTISKEQLKEIRSFSKNNWTRYHYKIKRVDKNIFDVNVTCEDEKYRFLHFKIKYEKFASKPLKLEILKKDFFTKETKELAKEFLEDKTIYYKIETLLKLKSLQEKAKHNISFPREIEQIIKENFLKNLSAKKSVYDEFLRQNRCFASYYNTPIDDIKYRAHTLERFLGDYRDFIKENCL